jgi:hypothetical protein
LQSFTVHFVYPPKIDSFFLVSCAYLPSSSIFFTKDKIIHGKKKKVKKKNLFGKIFISFLPLNWNDGTLRANKRLRRRRSMSIAYGRGNLAPTLTKINNTRYPRLEYAG